ncbi:hypothetical protein MPER_06297, partial [Moniliophthora perniciosa FA553]
VQRALQKARPVFNMQPSRKTQIPPLIRNNLVLLEISIFFQSLLDQFYIYALPFLNIYTCSYIP